MAWYKCNGDLFRCELCRHGPDCKRSMQGTCGYAHKLNELLPPREVELPYDNVWRDGVHRWYGQELPQKSIDLILWYLRNESVCDIPTWTHGLKWYMETYSPTAKGMDMQHDPFPADFGIEQDLKYVLRVRKGGQRPFKWMPELWRRISRRRGQKERALESAFGVVCGVESYPSLISGGCWWYTKQEAPSVEAASDPSDVPLKFVVGQSPAFLGYCKATDADARDGTPASLMSFVEQPPSSYVCPDMSVSHDDLEELRMCVVGGLYKRLAVPYDNNEYGSANEKSSF